MTGVNLHGVRAIYRFEMNRAFRTWMQSLIAPVLTTALYFIVFGSAIGSRMGDIGGVSYGAYIIPGLHMLSLHSESISNSAFGIYMPKWTGTIYELLSAPVNWVEVLLGYVGAAASKRARPVLRATGSSACSTASKAWQSISARCAS